MCGFDSGLLILFSWFCFYMPHSVMSPACLFSFTFSFGESPPLFSPHLSEDHLTVCGSSCYHRWDLTQLLVCGFAKSVAICACLLVNICMCLCWVYARRRIPETQGTRLCSFSRYLWFKPSVETNLLSPNYPRRVTVATHPTPTVCPLFKKFYYF